MNQYGMAGGGFGAGMAQAAATGQYVPGHHADMVAGASVVSAIGSVRASLVQLDQTVDRLEKSLALLYNKLQPVLYNGPETANGKAYAAETAPGGNNEVTAHILQIESRLSVMSAAVVGIAERADI
jgi:hypothetical protein